ncbi:MAG: radical SAM protein [Chloroflexi bacterium]|nr:radical SAM protein [Chloroflexota bacterium]
MPESDTQINLGTRTREIVRAPKFPDAGAAVREHITARERPATAVDVLLVNPPAPDGGIWIRSQHRVGRKSRENMIWPQVSLAQMAALLAPDYTVAIIDAIAERMTWPQFEARLRAAMPKYYLTQVTAPTLQNDMYGVFLAKSLGARTMAMGTHVTPMWRETLEPYPALDFVLQGEPEMTLREVIDAFEGREPSSENIRRLLTGTGSNVPTQFVSQNGGDLSHIKGLGWRRGAEITLNTPRPFIPNLDDLPIPLHHLLPLDKYRMPMMKSAYTFIVSSRGCSAGCTYCIKHVSYQWTLRLRSPENIVKELWVLKKLGINYIHMYADLFTLSRNQVVELCRLIIDQKLDIKWTCNSRVDYVDAEMLSLMGRAGCWMISWGIESGNEAILHHARKGADPQKARRALTWARAAGIKNWGYFIIGLPGETELTIRESIEFSKQLPLDIALFHIAAPYPGTPFFFEVVRNGWFRPGTRWEEVDMDRSTVLDYPHLKAERLEYWQKRAFREWAYRPGPILTFLKGMNSWEGLKSALDIAFQHFTWASDTPLAGDSAT